MLYKQSYTSISDISEKNISETHIFKGWIKNIRKQQNIIFLELYDGSNCDGLQIIIEKPNIVIENTHNVFPEAQKLTNGCCVSVTGNVTKSISAKHNFEVIPHKLEIYGIVKEPLKYLPNAKKIDLDTLRPIHHMRPKFRKYQAIYRIRSNLMKATHEFFHNHQFYHLDPNVVTTSDCEGAGETFTITNLKSGDIDYQSDFFRKHAYLTVSSQLQLEALCSGMSKVYTTNPSFRAEPSHSTRHLGCFTHIEWEIAFITLTDLMNFSEDYVKYCFQSVINNCNNELEFLSKGFIETLKKMVSCKFASMSYDDAIDIITKNKIDVCEKYKISNIPVWGDDLGSFCEKYLTEYVTCKPTFVYNYPKKLKSFYMKQNDPYTINEEIRETVQGCDLLLPGLGELIGSSIREDNYEKLRKEIQLRKMDEKKIQWYMDLRKDATFPHGGAGLGFDRLVTVCCSLNNIRDAVPFPVAYEECFY